MPWPLRLSILVALLCIGDSSAMRIECEEGWTGFSASASCYKFIRQSKTFDEASYFCQYQGGHLAYINTQKEHDWLTVNIGKLSGADKNKFWWMGLRFDEKAAHYQWLDNTDVDDSIVKWSAGLPGDSKDCGVLSSDGFLRIASCSSEVSAYVCERPIGAPVLCAKGWETHGESCYKVFLDEALYFGHAENMCEGVEGFLVLVNTQEENTFIKGLLPDQDFWIGLREVNGNYEWCNGYAPDGSEGFISNWQEGQPIKSSDGNKNAAYMTSTDSDKWSTLSRNEKLYYICERPQKTFCQFDLESFGPNCYDVQIGNDYTLHDWRSSEEICNKTGMRLPVVDHYEENWRFAKYVAGRLTQDNAWLWLGYIETEVNSKQIKRISDGKLIGDKGVYSELGKSYADDFNELEYDVVAMYVSKDPEENEHWFLHPDTKIDAIVACQIPVGSTIDASGIMHPKEKCPGEEWTDVFGGNCYASFPDKKTWSESKAFCKALYQEADLVSISHESENDFIHELAKKMSDHTWIGFSDRFAEGVWQWSDGSPNSFTAWNTGEPNGATGENCAEIINGGWNDIACDVRMTFICKTKAIREGDPVLPETTTMHPYPNCGSVRGWIEDTTSGICYYKVEQGELKWPDAVEECKFMDSESNLVSINSVEEQTFLNHWLRGTDQYWIGLNSRNKDATYVWSDFSPVSFVNWQEKEPDSNDEKCCQINMASGGRWNNANCESYHPVICEKKGLNYVKPIPPDPTFETKCSEGWEAGLGRCYYYSWMDGISANNFRQAVYQCKLLNPGATLISIRNSAEQKLVEGKQLPGKVYIGASREYGSQVWTWSDGSDWSYENWAEGQPSFAHWMPCVEMLQDGHWKSIACDDEEVHNFICTYENVICPEHWTYFDGSCWYFPSHSSTGITDAETNCAYESPKSHVASIHSEIDNDFVAKTMLHHEIMIGLKFKDNWVQWVWLDDSRLDFTSWDSGEPADQTKRQCALINQNGKWRSHDCSNSQKTVCRLRPDQYLTCPVGWEKYHGYCYMIQTKLMNFRDAERSCKLGGGQLASIVDVGENDFIQSAVHYHSHERCPTGWLYDGVYKKCYMVSDYSETWTKSVTECRNLGTILMHIDSLKKAQRLVDLGVDVPDFWIDATDRESEGHWKWESDGQDLTYFNWAAGEPNGGTKEQNILVSVSNAQHSPLTWSDEDGDTLHRFICEMDQNDYEHQDETISWIGLTDLRAPQTFEWSENTNVLYTNWGSGLPNKHIGETGKSCTVMSSRDGFWYHANCEEQRISVCKTRQEVTVIKPDTYGCSEGEVEYEASCFQFRMAKDDFASAKRQCSAGGEGHLVTFNTKYEEAIVIAQLATMQSAEFYIGMTYNPGDQKFYWLNGDVVDHTNWGDKQPDVSIDDQEQELCVSIKNEFPFGWRWFVSKCDEKRHYICEKPRKGYTTLFPPTTTTNKRPLKCYPGWHLVRNHCFIKVTQQLSFDDARRYCRAKSSDMATFDSLVQEKAVISAIRGSVPTGEKWKSWFGLTVFEGTGLSWVNGAPVSYLNWMDGEPTGEGCVLVTMTQEGSTAWMSQECSLQETFICDMEAFEELPPTTPAPTLGPHILCHEGQQDGWFRRKDTDVFCYKFGQNANQINWHHAELACRKEEAHLASIRSEAENSFITFMLSELLASKPIDSSWIGLNALDSEQVFQWTDGSPIMYENWAEHEPNFADNLESCVEIYAGSLQPGHWNDALCSKQLQSYVCKKPRDGGWTTPVPTSIPSGHCPDNHHEFRGHCYIMNGGNSSPRSPDTWSNARTICKGMGPTYDLASVHNIHESAFLASLVLSSGVQDAWIGFHVPFIHDGFVWSDQSSIDFDHWAPKQPGSHSEMNTACVAILGPFNRYFGRWEDLSCDNRMPYICQTKVSPEHTTPPSIEKCLAPYEDFVSFDGNCFLSVPEKKTWALAEEDCRKKSAHLVSVLDMSTQYFVINQITSSQAWIGLSNIKDTARFEWSDNFGVHMTNWNGSIGSTTDHICASMHSADGKWYPSVCSMKMEYVCKFSQKPDPGPDVSGDCAEGFQTFGLNTPYCYRLSEAGSGVYNWMEANELCRKEGGHLASIHDESTNTVIFDLAKRIKHDLYIGLMASDDSGSFIWTDGSAMDFLNWDKDEPYEVELDKCVALNQNGKWNTIGCSGSYASVAHVCQVTKTKVTTTTEKATTSKPTTHLTSTSSTTKEPTPTSSSSTTSGSSLPTTTTTTHLIITPNGGGLSSGSVAAIVIMTMLLIGAMMGGVIFWKRKDIQLRQMFAHTPLRSWGRNNTPA